MRQLLIALVICAGAASASAQTQWQFESELATGFLIFDDQNPNFAPNSVCVNDCLLDFEFSDQMGNAWDTKDDLSLGLLAFGASTSPDDLAIIIFDIDDVTPPAGSGERLLLIGAPNGQISVNVSLANVADGTFRVVPEPSSLSLAAMALLVMSGCIRRGHKKLCDDKR